MCFKLVTKTGPTIFFDKFQKLNGTEEILVKKVGDGSIIERFAKIPVPRSPTDIVCPTFLELRWAYGCPFRCSYCYLQGTLRFLPTEKQPRSKPDSKVKLHLMTFLANVASNMREILNSGELADSLMFEGTKKALSQVVLPLFVDRNPYGHKVLILTKSDKIDQLLNMEAQESVVASFSINTGSVATKWEKGTALPKDRINAASKLFETGYEVRIRIDPMIPYPENNWKIEYLDLIDEIFSLLMPERITIGSLRGLQTTINHTSDTSWLTYLKENSKWGKRLSTRTRLEMYSTIIEYLKKRYYYDKVALCKEPVFIWEKLHLNWKNCRCNCVW
ncbi:MAG: radical SAM protein [Candidatus Bathyarchaeia archaeon]